MPPSHVQCVLGFLALFGSAHGRVCVTSTPECTVQAWVRAPDLTPNAIIHGDARVKISPDCPDVDNVLLGLRFKERSFMKALRSREDVKWLHPMVAQITTRPPNVSPRANVPSRRFPDRSIQDAYNETVTNKELWIVKEEERTVFETTHPINIRCRQHGALREAIQDFGIFVPSTNFPPTLDAFRHGRTPPRDGEIVNVEWIYEYFAQVTFANGTTKEIVAGFTAFQPLQQPTHASDGLSSATVELQPIPSKHSPVANYSVEIIDTGLAFVAGSKNCCITAVVTRTGPARTFTVPPNVSACIKPNTSFKWAAGPGVPDNRIGFHRFPPPSVLRATANGSKNQTRSCSPNPCQNVQKVAVFLPDSTPEEIQTKKTVTTKSKPFEISIDIDDDYVPTFETYYLVIASSLAIDLVILHAENDIANPDEPFAESLFTGALVMQPSFDDDEPWVPWEKKPDVPHRTARMHYTGHVPVIIHPRKQGTSIMHYPCKGTDMSGQVVLSEEMWCERPPLVHYLTEGARGPIFVDHSVTPEPMANNPAERQLGTPILQPVLSSPPPGEEAVYRYYRPTDPKRPLIYVGETWAKKVAHKAEVSTATPSE